MNKLLWQVLALFILGGVFFLGHRYFIHPFFKETSIEFIEFSYLFNFSATLLIVLFLFLISLFTKDFLGYLFMAFGGLKLIFFILMANKFGFTLNRSVFLHFFFPYLMGLGIEIFFLIKVLQPPKPDNINDLEDF